jgi:hypothetical protein
MSRGLGFRRVGNRNELSDERRKDSCDSAVLLGITAPFSVRLSDPLVSLQRCPDNIERPSFARATQTLLKDRSTLRGVPVESQAKPLASRGGRISHVLH